MPANYVLLERIELNASAASVVFDNIPQTGYTDLKIVCSTRNSAAGQDGGAIRITFNSSATNYSGRWLRGSGSSVVSSTSSSTHIDVSMNTALPSSGNTANTFSNVEVYIPNYTSSSYKSVSADAVGENNTTAAYLGLTAGLWSDTAAITKITLVGNSDNYVQYSTFSLYGLAATGTTPVIAPKASGGNITTDGTYWIHTFLANGTFTPQTALSCDYLVVAGGGSGGFNANGAAGGGGGGAGGLLTANSFSVTGGSSYTISIGAGGAGTTTTSANGSDSVFSSITSTGGGAGGYRTTSPTINGTNGGSGGGSADVGTAGTGTSGQGNNGGVGFGSSNGYGGGGGGGKNGAGSNGVSGTTGAGGTGYTTTFSGSSVVYAGGGSGGSAYQFATIGSTTGGGGLGGERNTGNPATVNTGGGGGGAGNNLAGARAGGNGGSGIVIIRYTIA